MGQSPVQPSNVCYQGSRKTCARLEPFSSCPISDIALAVGRSRGVCVAGCRYSCQRLAHVVRATESLCLAGRPEIRENLRPFGSLGGILGQVAQVSVKRASDESDHYSRLHHFFCSGGRYCGRPPTRPTVQFQVCRAEIGCAHSRIRQFRYVVPSVDRWLSQLSAGRKWIELLEHWDCLPAGCDTLHGSKVTRQIGRVPLDCHGPTLPGCLL
jgi:hypothetical protein